MSIDSESFVYFMYSPANNVVKIGTTNNKHRRYKAIRTMSATKIVFIGSIAGSYEDESALHHRFNESRVHGEWFTVNQSLNEYLISLFGCEWRDESIEGLSISKDILFPEYVMDTIIPYSFVDGKVMNVKFANCNHALHAFHREKQILSMRTNNNQFNISNKSFERSEQRRELIMPILKNNIDMTTIDAISQLDEKSKKRKAA